MARLVSMSHKGYDPKIGLTMRQPGLGKLEWIKEDRINKEKEEKKLAKAQEKEAKGSKGGKKK